MKNFLLLLLVFIILIACKSKNTSIKGYEINGNISGFDSAYVQLTKLSDNHLITIDSTFVIKGNFQFKGQVSMPEMHYLVFSNTNHMVKLFLENSNISFKAHFDSLNISSIEGSKSHTEFKSYEEEIRSYENKMSDLYQQYKAASEQKDQPLMDQLDSTRMSLNSDMGIFIKNYIGTHNKSVVAPYILSKISNRLELAELDSLLENLDRTLSASKYWINLAEKVQVLKNVEPGCNAPDFTISNQEDDNVQLSAFKGKAVLLYFWASWSGPSRGKTQEYLRIYKEFNIHGLEIIGISLDNDKEKWIQSIKNQNIPWIQVSDLKLWNSDVVKLYGIDEIPYNILIDKNGIIVGKYLEYNDLHSKLMEILK